MRRLEEFFSKWVVRRRWWIICVALLLIGITGTGSRNLSFINDVRIFFSEKNPQLQALEALESTFTKDDFLLFVIAPRQTTVFDRRILTAVDELTETAWTLPFSSRINSLTNYQHTQAEGDDLIVEDLVADPSALTDQDIERIQGIALAEPLLVNRLLSPDGRVTGVSVNCLLPGKSIDEVRQVVDAARTLKAQMEQKYPEMEIRLTGGIMIDNAFGEASEKDMKTLVPIMYGVLLVIIGLALRSVVSTLATMLVIGFSMTTGMGLAGWLHIPLTPGSANAPTIILTLAVADSIHILATMLHRLRQGMAQKEAVIESLRINLQPVFITSFTTSIGFLSMNLSDAPPFRDLGNIVAMGVAAAFFYSIFLLPALMAIVPLRVKPRAAKAKGRMCDRLAEFIIRFRTPIFGAMLAIMVLLTLGTVMIELNDNFIKYFDQSYAFRRDADFTEKNLTGMNIIEYSLESGETGGINRPDYLMTMEKFANWYRQHPKVMHVRGITEIMKRLNQNMHGDDPAFYKIPDDRQLAAQYLLLYEMSLPFGLDLNNQINVDKSSSRMTVTLRDVSAKELREMDARARDWLRRNAPKTMFTYGSGLSIMFAHISERNIKSMLSGSLLALVLISGILILALRSPRLGLTSLIPNIAPGFMGFGIWGLLVGEVGLAVSVMIAMTMGLVVDDTVHFMSKYQRARKEEGMAPEDAVRNAFHTVGDALWFTTVILVAGFSVLSLSGFKVNADMGLMTAITVSLALVMDFFFLPTLLLTIDGRKGGPQ